MYPNSLVSLVVSANALRDLLVISVASRCIDRLALVQGRTFCSYSPGFMIGT